MAGRQRIGTQVLRGCQQVGDLTVFVAANAGNRRHPLCVGRGKFGDYAFTESLLHNRARNAECRVFGDAARIANILSGAARTFFPDRRADRKAAASHRSRSDPARSSPATTEESTPPDIATTTRVSCGSFARSIVFDVSIGLPIEPQKGGHKRPATQFSTYVRATPR